MRSAFAVIASLSLVLVACSEDPTESDEYQQLERRLAAAEQQIEDMADAGAGSSGAVSGDRTQALETVEEIKALLDDPDAFGSEDEVADLIAEHATDSAVMDDEVFGAVPYRSGFYNTLFGGAVDAQIDIHHSWVSADGSQGGVLWLWHGTNASGNPFELAGISIIDFDEDGRVAYELVTYPYPDGYVDRAVFGEGTPTPSTGSTG